MSKTGRFFVHIEGRTFVVEPISDNPNRNAEWTNGGIDKIKGGAITPEESIIGKSLTEGDGLIELLTTLPPGQSPLSYLAKITSE